MRNQRARLSEFAMVKHVDAETGATTRRRIEAGTIVWVESGIARPTMQGGGFECSIVDLATGWRGMGRVGSR